MLIHQPTLAGQFASLRATAQADDARGWLPASLHALIMACLVRLFSRLEQLVLAWQSGTLPALHQAAARTPAAGPAGEAAPTLQLRQAQPAAAPPALAHPPAAHRSPKPRQHRRALPHPAASDE